jgi:hypothetical protein
MLASAPITTKLLSLQHLRAYGDPGLDISVSTAPLERAARNGFCAASAFLRLLGYMDTLVHFGRFNLAVLANSKIDSWLVAN